MNKLISDIQQPGRPALVIRFLQDAKGATAVEYGLIASLIAVAIVGVIATIGADVSALLRSVDLI
ncbi:Flp/Fap pilin component [Rhodobiaceae bacterium]|nr:Flp/Fap pilin component [Rhodobiaceae bacterium]